MVPVHTLMEDDSPCRRRRPAAAATGSARVPCLLASFRGAALHPRGVRTARAPPRGERSQGASVYARQFPKPQRPNHRKVMAPQYFHRAPLAPSSTPCSPGTGCPYFAARRCLFPHVACQASHHEFSEYQSTDGLGALSTAFTTENFSACLLACSHVEPTYDYAPANMPDHGHNSYGRQRPPVDPMPSCFTYDQQSACAKVIPTISLSDNPSPLPCPEHQESNGLEPSARNVAPTLPLTQNDVYEQTPYSESCPLPPLQTSWSPTAAHDERQPICTTVHYQGQDYAPVRISVRTPQPKGAAVCKHQEAYRSTNLATSSKLQLPHVLHHKSAVIPASSETVHPSASYRDPKISNNERVIPEQPHIAADFKHHTVWDILTDDCPLDTDNTSGTWIDTRKTKAPLRKRRPRCRKETVAYAKCLDSFKRWELPESESARFRNHGFATPRRRRQCRVRTKCRLASKPLRIASPTFIKEYLHGPAASWPHVQSPNAP